jgi:hypothetical protein
MNYRCLIFFLLIGINVFGQNTYPYVSVIDKDTVIVFSFSQGIELSLRNEDLKKYIKLNEIKNKEIDLMDSLITVKKKKIQDCKNIIKAKEKIVENKEILLSICDDEKEILKKEISRQKRHKWIAISGGIILAVIGIVF